MKRFLSYLLIAVVIAPALVSCGQELQDSTPPAQKHTVYFTAVDDATRTGLSIDGTTVNPNWSGTVKEDVHLYEMNGDSKVMGQTQSLSFDDANIVARFSAEFSGPAATGNKYGAVVAQMKDDGAFYIPAIQNPQDATLKDPSADFLVGYSRFAYDGPTGEDGLLVDLFFDRVAALSRIGFSNFKGGSNEKVMQVKIKSETSMTGSATINNVTFGNPSKVSFTPDEGVSELTLNYGEGVSIPTDGTFYSYFVSVPGTFKITGIEIKTDKYLYTKAPNANVTFTLTELKNLKVDLGTTTIPVESVSLNKNELALNVGATETLTATVLPDLASNKNVTWTSSDANVATVDENGKVTAVAQGEAVITATTVDGGKPATCTVTVSDVYEYSLEIVAEKDEINVNEELAYTAKLTTKKNGNVVGDLETLTSGVTWTSSSPAIAEINENTGLAKGKAGGTTNITASCEPEHADEPVTATVTLTVNDVVSHSLEISPASTSINVGGTQAYTAIYKTITNGEITAEETVTSTASWTSGKESVATIAGGTATGVGNGETTITATYEGITSNVATLTVNDVVTYSLAIVEGDKEINVGGTQAYTATLTTIKNGGTSYVQTTTDPVTPTISSDETTVATVSGNTATGIKSGTANISASYVINGVTVNTTTSVKLTVNDVVTYSLAVNEGDKEINVGGTQAYTATLTTFKNAGTSYGTTTTEPVTPTLTSDNTAVAVIDGASAEGIASGTANISASYVINGQTVNTTTSVKLTVKDVIEYSLAIEPNEDVRVYINKTLGFILKLTTVKNRGTEYASTETNDVTATTWNSSDTDIAAITDGTATGFAEGTVKITAKYTPTGSSEELQAEVLLTVLKDPNHAGDPIGVGEEENL